MSSSPSMPPSAPSRILQEGEADIGQESEAEGSGEEEEDEEEESPVDEREAAVLEEVEYSDGTSEASASVAGSVGQNTSSSSESVYTDSGDEDQNGDCGECGKRTWLEKGRVDDDDGVWYCDGCWAAFESDSSSLELECTDDMSLTAEQQTPHVTVSAPEKSGDAHVEKQSMLDQTIMDDKTKVQSATSARCSACSIVEMGGHTSANGEQHYCDWCWAEGSHEKDCWNPAETCIDEDDDCRGTDDCPLPIEEFRDEIMQSIRHNTVTSILGETGCGKSSMVPQFILEDCTTSGHRVKIMVTQVISVRVWACALTRSSSNQHVFHVYNFLSDVCFRVCAMYIRAAS